jgi:hypothetical protein
MEEALQSRVNEAREALQVAKQNFRCASVAKNCDPELQREREIIAARIEMRAIESLLTAVIDFNAFILGDTVPKHLPPHAADLLLPICERY